MPLPSTPHITQSENNNRPQFFCIYGNGEVARHPHRDGLWEDPRTTKILKGWVRSWVLGPSQEPTRDHQDASNL